MHGLRTLRPAFRPERRPTLRKNPGGGLPLADVRNVQRGRSVRCFRRTVRDALRTALRIAHVQLATCARACVLKLIVVLNEHSREKPPPPGAPAPPVIPCPFFPFPVLLLTLALESAPVLVLL